jgi:hypothetical protein
MQKWVDDYGAYRRFIKTKCLCGHDKHCKLDCPKCTNCKECECEDCLLGKGYN